MEKKKKKKKDKLYQFQQPLDIKYLINIFRSSSLVIVFRIH